MTVTPYKNSLSTKKKQVEVMFDNIAPRYDFLNHFLSCGIDILWRKKVIKLLNNEKPEVILDVATGTADFAIESLRLNPKKIYGVDLSEEMLSVGREKILKNALSDKIELLSGDAENLPFNDCTFDIVTVGFGVRNFENLEKGLTDMYRVIKKNGKVAILEFSKPRNYFLKTIYLFYFLKILPLIGKLISKDNAAYTYLPQSVLAFPDGEKFLFILQNAGFKNCKYVPLTFGISSIYIGEK